MTAKRERSKPMTHKPMKEEQREQPIVSLDTTKRCANSFTREDGHQLAADMIREIREEWEEREEGVPEEQITDLWRKDKSEVLRRYLATVRKSHSRALEHGFFAVLTDILGNDDCVLDPEAYEAEARDG
jgi:hypothetical protein